MLSSGNVNKINISSNLTRSFRAGVWARQVLAGRLGWSSRISPALSPCFPPPKPGNENTGQHFHLFHLFCQVEPRHNVGAFGDIYTGQRQPQPAPSSVAASDPQFPPVLSYCRSSQGFGVLLNLSVQQKLARTCYQYESMLKLCVLESLHLFYLPQWPVGLLHCVSCNNFN